MRALTVLFAAAVILGVSGCASSGSSLAQSKVSIVNDEAYMAVVEQKAALRGVRLAWVNPPKVRVEQE